MPVPYWDIENEIAEILRANLSDCTIVVEDEQMFSPEQTPWIGVYLERRDPHPQQPMAAGTKQRLVLRFSIWIWCFALERVGAFIARDDAISRAEAVLMKHRRLNEKVEMILLQGGAMPSARVSGMQDGANFLAGGEIVVSAVVMASV